MAVTCRADIQHSGSIGEMRSKSAVLAIALSCCAAVWSCGGDATEPESGPQVASVAVIPAAAILNALGDTLRLAASARNSQGGLVAGRTFTWSSSDPTVATVNASGLTTAVAGGLVSVTATTGGVAGSASVTVQTTGGLRVITATVGRNLDADGYTILLDGVSTATIGIGDTVTIDDLAAGQHSVSLGGLRDTCYGISNMPVSVNVIVGSFLDVHLDVECLGVPEDISLTFARSRQDPDSLNLFGLAVGETDPVQLTFQAAFDRSPAWSSDGTRLAFSRDDVIHVVNSDGTGLKSFASGTNPDWSPDGTEVAYQRSERTYILDVDGSGEATFFAAAYEPAWSPDGTKIAYVVPVEGAPVAQSDIYVVNADGSGRVNLTQNPELLDREPAWSPDGSRIVFRRLDRSESSGYDLWVMDADGSNPERILMLAGAQISPTWLPDDRILFQGSVPSVLDRANGTVEELVNAEPGYFYFDPAWRPR